MIWNENASFYQMVPNLRFVSFSTLDGLNMIIENFKMTFGR